MHVFHFDCWAIFFICKLSDESPYKMLKDRLPHAYLAMDGFTNVMPLNMPWHSVSVDDSYCTHFATHLPNCSAGVTAGVTVVHGSAPCQWRIIEINMMCMKQKNSLSMQLELSQWSCAACESSVLAVTTRDPLTLPYWVLASGIRAIISISFYRKSSLQRSPKLQIFLHGVGGQREGHKDLCKVLVPPPCKSWSDTC